MQVLEATETEFQLDMQLGIIQRKKKLISERKKEKKRTHLQTSQMWAFLAKNVPFNNRIRLVMLGFMAIT